MKQLINLFLFSLLAITLPSCSNDDEGIVTQIEPEATEVTIGSEAASFSIKTKRSGWFLDELQYFSKDGSKTIVNETKNINGVDVPLDTMAGSWYQVVKSAPNEIAFQIAENETGKERKLIVTITGIGMSYDDLTVIQQ